jgi:hypothetical protein
LTRVTRGLVHCVPVHCYDAAVHDMGKRTRGMGRIRLIIAVLVAAAVLGSSAGLASPVTEAQAKSCQTPAGRYDVNPPAAGSRAGADPAEVAAADCTLGFHEDTAYPLSVIGLALLATLATLLLLRRGTSYDAIGREA